MKRHIFAWAFLSLGLIGCTGSDELEDDRSLAENIVQYDTDIAKNPVLLIPGIAGSVLEHDDPATPDLLEISWIAGLAVLTSETRLAPPSICLEVPALTSYLGNYWCINLSGGDQNFRKLMLGNYNKETQEIDPYFAKLKKNQRIKPHVANNCRHVQARDMPDHQLCGIEYLFSPSKIDASFFDPLEAVLKYYRANNPSAYFAQMAEKAISMGYVPGGSLFGFPYDWRLSNLHTADLLNDRITEIFEATKGKKVDLVAHSMGNLVVVSYLAKYNDNANNMVANYVALAAPFKGVPNVMTRIIPGYNFGNDTVCGCTTRPLMVQTPTSFELMPAADFDWESEAIECKASETLKELSECNADRETSLNRRPFINYTSADNSVLEAKNNDEVITLLQEAFGGYEVCAGNPSDLSLAGGEKVAAGFSDDAKTQGDAFFENLKLFETITELPNIYVAYGDGLATPYGVDFPFKASSPKDLLDQCGGNHCTAATKCSWSDCVAKENQCETNFTFSVGDGTLDTASATHPPFDAKFLKEPPLAFEGLGHVPLIQDAAVIKQVFEKWLNKQEQP